MANVKSTVLQLEIDVEELLVQNSITVESSVHVVGKLSACCSLIRSSGVEGFGHAARVLSCMHQLVASLPRGVDSAELSTDGGRALATALVMSDILPEAADLIIRLAPRHTSNSPTATCTCCRSDAPTWSRLVAMPSSAGTRQKVTVSEAVTMLIDRLLTVVLVLMACIEQRVEIEASAAAGAGFLSRPPGQDSEACSAQTQPGGSGVVEDAGVESCVKSEGQCSLGRTPPPARTPHTAGPPHYQQSKEQGQEVQQQQHHQGATLFTWQQLSECLHEVLEESISSQACTCQMLAKRMLRACAAAFSCETCVATPSSETAGNVLSKSLSAKGAGVWLWPGVQRSCLVSARITLSTKDAKSAAFDMLSHLDHCCTFLAALAPTFSALGAGGGKQEAAQPQAVAWLSSAARIVRSMAIAMGKTACLANIKHTQISTVGSSAITLFAKVAAPALCTMLPASWDMYAQGVNLSERVNDEDAALGAAHTFLTEAVRALRMFVLYTRDHDLGPFLDQQFRAAAILEEMAVAGLKAPASAEKDEGSAGEPAQGLQGSPPASRSSANRANSRDLSGGALGSCPSARVCAWQFLTIAMHDASKRTITPANEARVLRLQLHLPALLAAAARQLEVARSLSNDTMPAQDAASSSSVPSQQAPLAPVEAVALLLSGWTMLVTCVRFGQTLPQVFALVKGCVRLHRAAVASYTESAPGRARDAWRAAFIETKVLHIPATVMLLLGMAPGLAETVRVNQVRSVTLAVVPWSLPVVVASLVQQTAQHMGPPDRRNPCMVTPTGAPSMLAHHYEGALGHTLDNMWHTTSQVCILAAYERNVVLGNALTTLCKLKKQQPSLDLVPRATATCKAALTHLRSGQCSAAEELDGSVSELVWALQLAEWVPRIGRALQVADAIMVSEGLGTGFFQSDAYDIYYILLLLDLPLALIQVLELWAELCEGVTTPNVVIGAEGHHRLRQQLLGRLFNGGGRAAAVGSRGEAGSASATAAGASSASEQGHSTCHAPPRSSNAPQSGGGHSSQTGPFMPQEADVLEAVRLVDKAFRLTAHLHPATAMGILSHLHVLKQELNKVLDECQGARDSKDPVAGSGEKGGRPCKGVGSSNRSASSSELNTDPLLIQLARSPLVHCLHAWSEELCAAAVARMEAACGL